MQAKGTTAVRLLVCDVDSQWALGRLLQVQCPADEVRIAGVHMRWHALALVKYLRWSSGGDDFVSCGLHSVVH